MSDWQEYRIGDHINPISGFPFASDKFTTDEGVPLIRIRDLVSSETEVNYSGKYNDTFLVENGDILIGMDGDFNIVKWKGGRALLNQRLLKLIERPKSELALEYIFYWLIPYLLHVNNITAATTVKHLSTSDVTNAIVKGPCRKEQQKIAKILTTVDNLIEKTEALIEKYQAIKQGMMHDLFTRGIDTNGQLRPSHHDAPHLYKQTELGWIPAEWKVTTLGELSNVVRGSTPRPAKDPRYFDGDYIPWITVGELSREDWPYLEDTTSKLTEEGAKYSRVLNADTLVISNSGFGCGVPKILKLTGCANDGIAAFLELSNDINKPFLYYYLRSQMMNLRTKVARGNDQPNLNTDMLSEFEVILPSVMEQERISDRLWCIEKVVLDEKNNKKKLSVVKKGLMQDLLTGKVRVK